MIWNRLRTRKGQGLVEYALILALVVIICTTSLTAICSKTDNSFGRAANMLP
ncbi:MAG: class III signal peptide-containing protein [Candidatus Brocadiia bacterium]|nr:class III signal peptide-containing protein [Candidatus Brocadiia bacterium]